MEGSVFTGNKRSMLGNMGKRTALIGAVGGGGLYKEQDALLCAWEVPHVRQTKDAGCVAVVTNSTPFGT